MAKEENKEVNTMALNDNKRCKNAPLEALYQVVALGTEHLEHVAALIDSQEVLLLSLPITDESFYFPCYLEPHEEYNLDQSTHNIHVAASYHQVRSQVQHLSAQQIRRILSNGKKGFIKTIHYILYNMRLNY